ncbi:MAG: proline--tRNA ligase [Bacilli bacterium]|jgi:prolyl-tRNA synthetase
MGTKKVKDITAKEIDFAQWYTDVVKKTELVDYSTVKGCLIIRPYGYAIWENIQKYLDAKFKETNHENVYMPLFIPESLLNMEKEHVEGFAPEVAWITHGGDDQLIERLCVRPTSEVLFCDHYSKIVKSYRDLPKLYNQWCSVVRWEKTTRPFLRSREFLWQEGHTIHATKEEAMEETLRMLNVYADFLKDYLAIPTIKGEKTPSEKFAGAWNTFTIEGLMDNGVALQMGTSHYFGDNFSKPFKIIFTNEFNEEKYVHQTSWGLSTRVIGGLIMVHGDNNGLVLPPNIAPTKIAIILINPNLEVKETAIKIKEELTKNNITNLLDLSDKTPGFKFSLYEMKGFPLRLELGPKDLLNQQCVLVRRDTGAKSIVLIENLIEEVNNLLMDIQNNLYEKALKRRMERTFEVKNLKEMKEIIDKTPGFIKAYWCGDKECEEKVKEETGASSRCIPLEQPLNMGTTKCFVCGKKATKLVYFGLQY